MRHASVWYGEPAVHHQIELGRRRLDAARRRRARRQTRRPSPRARARPRPPSRSRVHERVRFRRRSSASPSRNAHSASPARGTSSVTCQAKQASSAAPVRPSSVVSPASARGFAGEPSRPRNAARSQVAASPLPGGRDGRGERDPAREVAREPVGREQHVRVRETSRRCGRSPPAARRARDAGTRTADTARPRREIARAARASP